MHRSISATSPVITFLSGSPRASKQTHQLLCSLFRMEDVPLYHCENPEQSSSSYPERQQQRRRRRDVNLNELDSLDKKIPNLLPSQWHWQSLASRCTSTGAIIHLLSMGPRKSLAVPEPMSGDVDDNDKQRDDGTMSLLSITDNDDEHYDEATTTSSETNVAVAAAAVKKSRRILASHIGPSISIKLVLMKTMGFSINATDIFGSNSSITPLIDIIPEQRPIQSHTSSGNTMHSVASNGNDDDDDDDDDDETIVLRELVLPFNQNGIRSLPSRLSGAGLRRAIDSLTGRPVVGLYQWPDSSSRARDNIITSSSSQNKKIVIRPLPAASEDKTLPPPSLIFQCPRFSIIESNHDNNNMHDNSLLQFAKIGFNGTGRSGQLRIHHANLPRGWDVRLCESKGLSSSFAEAEESLLAGSLSELQSAHVLAEGGSQQGTATTTTTTRREADKMMGVGDCWAEFRATVKNPSGYFKNSSSSKVRVAKVPDLPYR